MKVMVSACLLGENCKYTGGNNRNEAVLAYVQDKQVVPVCPEMMAGLGCPRVPIEIVNGVVTDKNGRSVDEAIRKAAAEAVELAVQEGVECAILQPRSPTCGVRQVYDGTFTGTRIPGSGILAQALRTAQIPLKEPQDLPEISDK